MTHDELIKALRSTESEAGIAAANTIENLTMENRALRYAARSSERKERVPYLRALVGELRKEVAELREKVPTPRDVIILDEDGREYIDYICPKCKETITQARKDVKTMILATRKYHEECGQPLKWPKPGEKYGSKYRGMPLPEGPEEGDKHGTTD